MRDTRTIHELNARQDLLLKRLIRTAAELDKLRKKIRKMHRGPKLPEAKSGDLDWHDTLDTDPNKLWPVAPGSSGSC